MRSRLGILALVLPLLSLAAAPARAQDDHEARARAVAAKLAELGHQVDLSKLTFEKKTREQAAEDWDAWLSRLHEPQLFETLHVLQSSFRTQVDSDLSRYRIERALDYIAAFPVYYAPHRKALVAVAELDRRDEHYARAMTLAGRDQQSDLETLMKQGDRTYEAAMIARAMAEGEAELAARRLAAAAGGGELDTDPDDYYDVEVHLDGQAFAPRREGAFYLLRRWRVGGAASLDTIWANRPNSSEKLLSRAKVLDEPQGVGLPGIPEQLGVDAELVGETTLGQLGTYALMRDAGIGRAVAWVAMLGWDGDRVRHWRTPDGDVVIWRTLWDRGRDAQQFARVLNNNASGRVRARGRAVDWILAPTPSLITGMGRALDTEPLSRRFGENDAATTATAEDEWTVIAGIVPRLEDGRWLVPRYDISVPAPEGWVASFHEGAHVLIHQSLSDYKDNFAVSAEVLPRGKTLDMLESESKQLLQNASGIVYGYVEKKLLDGRETLWMRYQSQGGATLIHMTTILFIQDGQQVAISLNVGDARWQKQQDYFEELLRQIEFKPVPAADPDRFKN